MSINDLRPLGVGEILDRAVTLFVRRFAVFVFILAIVAIPVAIVQFALQPQQSNVLGEFIKLAAVPPGHPEEQRAILAQMQRGNGTATPLFFLFALVSVVASLLSTTALSVAVATAYGGVEPSVRVSYAAAFRRWFAQFVTELLFIALGVGVYIALALLALLVALGVAGLATISKAAAIVFGIVFGLLALVVIVCILALGIFIWQLAAVSIAIEEPRPFLAIRRAYERTVSRPVLVRSLLTALSLGAILLLGSAILASIGALLAALTREPAVAIIVLAIGGIVEGALLRTYIVVYSFDVRVRREGYDLLVAAGAAP